MKATATTLDTLRQYLDEIPAPIADTWNRRLKLGSPYGWNMVKGFAMDFIARTEAKIKKGEEMDAEALQAWFRHAFGLEAPPAYIERHSSFGS